MAKVEANATDNFLSDFFTKDQLGKVLNKDPRTLDRWHAMRQGPPRIKLGRTILYRRSSVMAWLGAQEERPRRRGR